MSDFMNTPPPPAPPPPQGPPPPFPQQYPPQYPQQYPPQFPQPGVYRPQVGGYPPGVVQHYGAAGRTSGLAIASMVLGILWIYWIGSILAVIFGHIAMAQTKRKGEGGRGMAIAGLILGYIGIAFLLLIIIAVAANPDAFDDT